jgi:hypothetical protein
VTTATPSKPVPARALDRAVVALGVVASAALLVALWRMRYFASYDGPQHLFQAYLGDHYADPGRGYATYLEPGTPVTALGFDVPFEAFERVASWPVAYHLTLSVILLGWGWGALALAAAIDPRRAPMGLLGFGAAFHWALYMGFFPFVAGTALGFFVLAIALRNASWSALLRVVLTVLLGVTAVAHVFCAQLVGLAMAGVVAARFKGRPLVRELALLVAMGLPALAVFAGTKTDVAGSPFSHATWPPFAERVSMIARESVGGPAWRAWPLVLVAAGGAASAIARARSSERRAVELPLALLSLALLAMPLATPLHLRGWAFFSPRFLPMGLVLGVALVPFEHLAGPRRRVALAGVAAFALAAIGWAARFNVRVDEALREPLSGLTAPLHRSGPRLEVILEPRAGMSREELASMPEFLPAWNLGKLYAIEQGGTPSFVFSNAPRIQSFVLSPEGRRAFPRIHDPIEILDPDILGDPFQRRALVNWLGLLGAAFEDVIVWGRPEDAALLVERGYEADVRHGGLFIGRFVGCPSEIRVVTPKPPRAPLLVELGWSPNPEPLEGVVIPAGAPGERGYYAVPRRTPLCGDVWYRVRAAPSRAGDGAAPEIACVEGGPDGRVQVRATKERGEHYCHLAEGSDARP